MLSESARKQAKELRAVMERYFFGPQTSEMMYAHLESLERKATVALDAAREEGRAEADRRACPCLYGNPCIPNCTCANRHSSYGCRRCCTYGSLEQRQKAAKRLIAQEPSPCKRDPLSGPTDSRIGQTMPRKGESP